MDQAAPPHQSSSTSAIAVKTQIWIAVSVYVLIAIIKKRLGLAAPLYTLLQVFSVSLFEKVELQTAFAAMRSHRNRQVLTTN